LRGRPFTLRHVCLLSACSMRRRARALECLRFFCRKVQFDGDARRVLDEYLMQSEAWDRALAKIQADAAQAPMHIGKVGCQESQVVDRSTSVKLMLGLVPKV